MSLRLSECAILLLENFPAGVDVPSALKYMLLIIYANDEEREEEGSPFTRALPAGLSNPYIMMICSNYLQIQVVVYHVKYPMVQF